MIPGNANRGEGKVQREGNASRCIEQIIAGDDQHGGLLGDLGTMVQLRAEGTEYFVFNPQIMSVPFWGQNCVAHLFLP
jgi:hypothetical protein